MQQLHWWMDFGSATAEKSRLAKTEQKVSSF
jgi:hypothetical protein